jgi:hypothetical protein
MSYPSVLTKKQMKIMNKAMNHPLYKKGDIVHRGKYRLLEDAKAHGCPWVEDVETGEKSCMTMYGHMAVFKQMCEDAGICSCTH